MKIKIDKNAGAGYIYLKKGKIFSTKKKQDWLVVDYDKNGEVLGVEILYHLIPQKELKERREVLEFKI